MPKPKPAWTFRFALRCVSSESIDTLECFRVHPWLLRQKLQPVSIERSSWAVVSFAAGKHENDKVNAIKISLTVLSKCKTIRMIRFVIPIFGWAICTAPSVRYTAVLKGKIVSITKKDKNIILLTFRLSRSFVHFNIELIAEFVIFQFHIFHRTSEK